MSKCPVCGERATKGKRGRSLHSAYTVSTLVEELKLYQTKAGQESAQAAARIVPYGETLASELHAWGHARPGAPKPDLAWTDEWIASVDYLVNNNFDEGLDEDF